MGEEMIRSPSVFLRKGFQRGQIHLALEAGTLRVPSTQEFECSAPVSLPRHFGNLYPRFHIAQKYEWLACWVIRHLLERG